MHGTDVTLPTDGSESAVGRPEIASREPSLFFGSPSPQSDNGYRDNSWIGDDYLDAQDSERRRLGRELHDSTGQLLVALSLSIAHLRHRPDSHQSEEILGEIDDAVRQIEQEIRTFSFINYPAELGINDLVVALEMFARGFGKRTGLQVKFQSCCKHAQAHPAVALALLRIAQEAMANVHRHARASSIHLSLVEHRGFVELIVKDDGCGLPVDHAGLVEGVGIMGMRHRIERVGGSFRIRRMKQGTKVTASLAAACFYAHGKLLGCAA